MGASFRAQNSGKRSLTLSLKSMKGKYVFMRLVKTADVVVESLRLSVMERDSRSNRYDFWYGHYPHRYHMVTAHRTLTYFFPAVWAGLPTGSVDSGAGLRK
jgi:hypothetical protein